MNKGPLIPKDTVRLVMYPLTSRQALRRILASFALFQWRAAKVTINLEYCELKFLRVIYQLDCCLKRISQVFVNTCPIAKTKSQPSPIFDSVACTAMLPNNGRAQGILMMTTGRSKVGRDYGHHFLLVTSLGWKKVLGFTRAPSLHTVSSDRVTLQKAWLIILHLIRL